MGDAYVLVEQVEQHGLAAPHAAPEIGTALVWILYSRVVSISNAIHATTGVMAAGVVVDCDCCGGAIVVVVIAAASATAVAAAVAVAAAIGGGGVKGRASGGQQRSLQLLKHSRGALLHGVTRKAAAAHQGPIRCPHAC
mgnify:CR=1 FL=1